MNFFVKILIISDDIEKWLSFFRGYHIVTTKNDITIQGNWFYIRLRNKISDNIRGEKYDKIVVDKFISDELLYTVVAPMISVPKIMYTKYEYRFGKETNE